MLYQKLKIGDGLVDAVIGYVVEDDAYFVIESITVSGVSYDIGVFEEAQLERIADKLANGHDLAVRESESEHRADMAAGHAEFREACWG